MRPRIYRNNAERQAAYRQWKRKRQPVQLPQSEEWETTTDTDGPISTATGAG
jgi:hypothetical protein